MRRLFSGSPFITTGPFSPPLKKPAFVERSSPAVCILGSWHAKQCSDSTGRILVSKKSVPSTADCARRLSDGSRSTRKRPKNLPTNRGLGIDQITFYDLGSKDLQKLRDIACVVVKMH